jgi:S-formylglutathione hydrolase FrmB
MMRTVRIWAAVMVALLGGVSAVAAPEGKVVRVKVHGVLLEGNLEGDSPDRDVSIFLPPSYETSKKRHYPVVYMLHGFTDSDEKWFGFVKHWINLKEVLTKSLGHSDVREMIVVMPNALTRYGGSWYSNSVTTGDWEDFVAKELVAYVDGHYRTIPNSSSRGIAGHSMGGYGAMRIGMKHPDVFSCVYLLSAAVLSAPGPELETPSKVAESVKDPADVEKAEFMTKVVLSLGAAWSPDPQNAPLYLTLPLKDEKWRADVAVKWAANTPLVTLDQYAGNLKKLKAIAFDAGDKDGSITENVAALDKALSAYGIPHASGLYDGDHLNHIADRIEGQVMPFFSRNLVFEGAGKHK